MAQDRADADFSPGGIVPGKAGNHSMAVQLPPADVQTPAGKDFRRAFGVELSLVYKLW